MYEELKSIEEVRAILECTEKGEVRKTVGNYRLILMHDPNLKGAFRLNMFTDKIDITRDLGWYRESESLTDVGFLLSILKSITDCPMKSELRM